MKAPNQFQTAVTESDIIDARGKSAASIAEKMMKSMEWAAPYSATFLRSVPESAKVELEKELKESFRIWAGTWIVPGLRQIIAKSKG